MTSYIPQYVYGDIRDENGYTGRKGLVPWPAHLQPKPEPAVALTKKGEAYASAAVLDRLPTLQMDGGTIFLTLKQNDRLSLATTIERLIDMLDAMSPDCDLEDGGDDEPSLGSQSRAPASFESPWGRGGYLHRDGTGTQEDWAAGSRDDREEVCEDEGAVTGDDEFSHGWANEGPQDRLGIYNVGEGEGEPELGWSDNPDQTVLAFPSSVPWAVEDGEPDLGFCGIATGWRSGESTDDCEQQCEDEGAQCDDEGAMERTDAQEGYFHDGAGVLIAKELLKGHKRHRPQFVPNYSERPVLEPNKPSYVPIYELKASDFDRLPWA